MAQLVVAVALLGATSVLLALSFSFSSVVAFALAIYVLASTEVVALTEILSLFNAVGTASFLVSEAVLLAIAVVAWWARGRPRPPRPEVDYTALGRYPLLAVLTLLVAASIVFGAFLVATTPPNNNDSMAYHLTRAAEWQQRQSVERFFSPYEAQNAYPANAEIESLYTLVFLERDTLAAMPQFLARLALLAAVFGLARLAGFGRPAAALASLVFSTLTLVVVQSVTTQNDLVVAALVASGSFFALKTLRGEVKAAPLAGLALGLAAGTKWTGAAAMALVAVLAISVSRDRRRLAILLAWALAGFLVVGIASYLRNLSDTGNPLGNVSELGGVDTAPTVSTVASFLYRVILDFADFSSYLQNANEDTSFFGTLGWLLILPLCAGFLIAWVLGRTSPLRGALALSLPLLLVGLALTHPYDRFTGRLLIPAVALVAPLVAWVWGFQWIARSVAALAIVTLTLAIVFNEAKPVGLTAGLDPIWSLDRVRAQTLKNPPMREVLIAVEQRVPKDGQVGAALEGDFWSYPLYGEGLERDVIYLDSEHDPLAQAERLDLNVVVADDQGTLDAQRQGWSITQFEDSGWLLAERDPLP